MTRRHPPAGPWRTLLRAAVASGSAGAALLAVHAAVNARLLRRPDPAPPATPLTVAVLLPARDEASRITGCIRSLMTQTGVPNLRVIVLDDASSDGTAELVRSLAGENPQVRVVSSALEPPPGWLGKPYACQRLADLADTADTADTADPPTHLPDVLVFIDADVVLAPHALAATVALLQQTGLDLVSPYPRQVALTPTERLTQPLLQWSWLSFLPLRLAETSAAPSLAAANGQLLAVRRDSYRRAGGHRAVRGEVLDDVALLRAVKRSGGRGAVVDGTDLATCRMYAGWESVREGYTKSLWSAFGSPSGAAVAAGLLTWLYVLPPTAALLGSRMGALGYAAGVAGRVISGRRTGARVLPDALGHPVGIAILVGLTGRSVAGRRRGTLAWRGRPLTPSSLAQSA